MNTSQQHEARKRAGFSMVEVALALLILSIGVLTMVGLMSGGLDMSKSAVDYTQTAIFASDTLEGVRYYASTVTNNGTSKFTDTLKTGLALKAVMGGVTGIFDTDTQGEKIQNTGTDTAFDHNFFYSYATNVDFACRYRISIDEYKDFTTGASFSGKDLNLAGQVAFVKLDVLNGLYGAATTQSFYTEVIQFVR